MKIIVNESQYKLLEQTGFDEITVRIAETYPDSVYLLTFIKDFIRKSECKDIKVSSFKIPAAGLSTMDGVILNKDVFHHPLSIFLYVLFHEVSHQYQYKKYGIDKMYGCYTEDVSIDEGAEYMKHTEMIADDFAIRKLREVQKLFGNQVKITIPNKVYEKVSVDHFKSLIETLIGVIKQKGYTDKSQISNILFNYVKNGK